MTKHTLPALILFAASAWAQPFSAGVKVGLPLTDFISTVSGQSLTTTNRFLVGPSAELHLPFGLGVEVDAIYRHFDLQCLSTITSVVPGVPNPIAIGPCKTGTWEFPLLLKYRFPGKVARPYLDAGVAWDKLVGLTSTVQNVASGNIAVKNSSTAGFVVGAGLDVHFVLHILPEVRYTRWTNQHFNIASFLNSNQNQAEFMVGITF